MKTLRGSGSRLTAEVVVGVNEFGSQVTCSVTLQRKDPELTELLEGLEGVFRRRALSYLEGSMSQAEIDERVRENTRRQLDRERKSITAIAEQAVAEKVADLERQLRTVTRTNDQLTRQVGALQTERAQWRLDQPRQEGT